jgi:bifunctional non-homologous end joining protein LigD
MTRRSTKSKPAAGAQLSLYSSTRRWLEEPRMSAEEIDVHNRAAAARWLFVIKKHDATRLHYDLRLEWNCVLKSWAHPGGPSYCPQHKREAVQMPDHAREYAGFEGMIAAGRPGAGTVMVWDVGTWELQPGCAGVDAALRVGCLKITMRGTKMNGNWTLVRMQTGDSRRHRPLWVFIKNNDEFARPSNEPNILEEDPNSVITGRSLDEIAADWVKGKKKDVSQVQLFEAAERRYAETS